MSLLYFGAKHYLPGVALGGAQRRPDAALSDEALATRVNNKAERNKWLGWTAFAAGAGLVVVGKIAKLAVGALASA